AGAYVGPKQPKQPFDRSTVEVSAVTNAGRHPSEQKQAKVGRSAPGRNSMRRQGKIAKDRSEQKDVTFATINARTERTQANATGCHGSYNNHDRKHNQRLG